MSIMKHVTLQKIVAHDFRYDPRNNSDHSPSEELHNTISAGGVRRDAVHRLDQTSAHQSHCFAVHLYM